MSPSKFMLLRDGDRIVNRDDPGREWVVFCCWEVSSDVARLGDSRFFKVYAYADGVAMPAILDATSAKGWTTVGDGLPEGES